MAITFSMRTLVVSILSVFIIILGFVLIMNISSITNIDLPGNSENKFSVSVIPNTSIKGTNFLITASSFFDIENQDLTLFVTGENYRSTLTLYDDGEHFDSLDYDSVYGGFFDSSDVRTGEYKIRDFEDNVLASFVVYRAGCEPIFNSYDEERVNFVIVPSHYEDYGDFKRDAKKIIEGENSLLNLEPFASNKDKFSFTLAQASRDLECTVGCNGIPTGICCNRELVFEEAAQCSYDSVIVLENSESFCGLASDYAAICAGNELSELVFTHEIGHTFGNLADEYVYEEAFEGYSIDERFVVNTPNCAVSCNEWEDVTNECFEGCTTSNLFRSSNNSIMGSPLVPEFNLVSRFYLLELISEHISVGRSLIDNPVSSYYVNLNYNEGKVEIDSVYLRPVKANPVFREGDYRVEILDSEGKLLYGNGINVPLIERFVNLSGILKINDKVSFSLSLPFDVDGNLLNILENDRVIASTGLSVFTDQCGNNICDDTENHVSCERDCSIEDGFCEEGVCDGDCESQKYCGIEKNARNIFPFVLIAIVLFVIVLFFFNRKK